MDTITPPPVHPASPAPIIREKDYFLAWLCFFLASTFGGFIIGAVLGGIMGFVMGVMGADIEIIQLVAGLLGFVISIPVSYGFFRLFAAKMIVGKLKP